MENLYYLYENDKLIGEFTLEEISKITGFSEFGIRKYAAYDKNYKNYSFIMSENTTFTKEWNDARFAILNAKVESKKVIIRKPFTIWKQPKRRLRRYVNK